MQQMDTSMPNKIARGSINQGKLLNNLNIIDENICTIHNQPFTKVCYQDSLALCKQCLPEHSHHMIIDPQTYTGYIHKKCLELEPQVQKNYEILSNMHLPKSDAIFTETVSKLESAKRELINLIEEYFKDVNNTFTHLCSKYPSQETQTLLKDKITQIKGKISVTKAKTNSQQQQMKPLEVAQYLSENYQDTVKEITGEINNLQQASQNLSNSNFQQSQNQNSIYDDFPSFKINNKCLEKIMFDLMNYITPVYTGTKNNQSTVDIYKPQIFVPNYFPLMNQPNIALLDDGNQCVLSYNLENSQAKQNMIPHTFKNYMKELPYQASMVMLPDNTLFISGGVGSKGEILGNSILYNLNTQEITKCNDMQVKRCGHSLVYISEQKIGQLSTLQQGKQNLQNNAQQQMIPSHNQKQQNAQIEDISSQGFIYCIGGRTNHNTRTKLCERYNIEKGTWTIISPLQSARSRPACCSVNDQFIYSFYGTNSFKKSVTSIERYDIMRDEWKYTRVENHLPGFDLCHSGAVQINQEQILLVGGFRDSMFFDKELLFNRKIMAFNIKSNTISLFDDTLPNDCIVQGQPIVHNGNVYVLGTTMKEMGDKAKINLDHTTLYQIGTKTISVQSILQFQSQQQDSQNIFEQQQQDQFNQQFLNKSQLSNIVPQVQQQSQNNTMMISSQNRHQANKFNQQYQSQHQQKYNSRIPESLNESGVQYGVNSISLQQQQILPQAVQPHRSNHNFN